MLVDNPMNDIHDRPYSLTVGSGEVMNSNMSGNINEIAQALSKAQSELEAAGKSQEGYGYNYSDLNSVINTAKPILAKHGLGVTQLLGHTGEYVSVTTILTHSSGQFFRSDASLPVIEMKGCNIAQGAGASISYLRRYAYQAILGMSSEDVDASSEGAKKQTAKKFEKPTPAKKVETKGASSGKKGTGFRRGAKPAEDDL